jgi:uncharacterized protein with von Willebrand factor type A (vWA) domain
VPDDPTPPDERPTDKDELLRFLDLGGAEADGPAAPLEIRGDGPAAAGPPSSPHAVDLDDWGRRRGQELHDESERLRTMKLGPEAVADLHGLAFLFDPQPTPKCADGVREGFVRTLLETPEYKALHDSTRLDPVASEVATVAFGEQLAALKKALDPPPPRKRKRGEKEEPTPVPPDPETETMLAAAKAAAEAAKDVGDLMEARAACGMGPGSPGANDPRRVAELYRRLRSNPTVRKVCELAGRYRRLAQAKQRQKTGHGLDDVVGVEPGGDVARLLPQELAKLAMPELELDTLRRLVEKQTLCREFAGVEPVGKGPVIVVCDESGSMQGAPNEMSKALGLAMAWVARRQNRWCALIAYSGDTGHRLLPLPPGGWDEVAVLDWVARFLSGGSHIDVPVREMPEFYDKLGAPKGVTDVVFITDAVCNPPDDVLASFRAWKLRAKARLITLVINSNPGRLAEVSDEVHRVTSLDVTEEAVGRVVSI